MKKQSGWRYMGKNWGWLSLFLFLLSLLCIFGFDMDKGGFFAAIAASFCMFMWVGAKDFFTKGPAD
jgi:hypothetical protein